jgi:hypothetical protein
MRAVDRWLTALFICVRDADMNKYKIIFSFSHYVIAKSEEEARREDDILGNIFRSTAILPPPFDIKVFDLGADSEKNYLELLKRR